jgi:hypothetical protein
MQFSVPQFTDVEDRLIGSLTLKQFLVLLGAGALDLFLWSVLGPSLPFFVLAVPIGLLGIAVAMGKFNGRPMFIYLMPFASYLTSNKSMVFRRDDVIVSVKKSPPKVQPKKQIDPEELEPTESRLRKLAYLLDKKSLEEKEIIEQDNANLIQTPPPALPKFKFKEMAETFKYQIKEAASNLTKPHPHKPANIPEKQEIILSKSESAPKRGPKPATPKKKKKGQAFDPSSIFPEQ